jgi:TRAP-type mannitol/chloroaromatic compound transport system substrate-binding protein
MKRRSLISTAALGAAATASSAFAQTLPRVRWRLTSSFPKSLDTIYGGAEYFAERVSKLTEGRFKITVHAPGEIVPALQAFDAVSNGTLEMCQTVGFYAAGKDPAFQFDAAIPFGMNARQQNAWYYHGGGEKLLRDLHAQYGTINFHGGNTGAQMGGWFRKEIKSVQDFKGMRFRIAGLSGDLVAKLGAVPQAIPAGETYGALEKGVIDAVEWIGPYDDEKLGFHKVAKNYYYPSFWEPGVQVSFIANSKEYEKLPAQYKEAIISASKETLVDMTAEYDTKNALAIFRLAQQGVAFKRFPDDILVAAKAAASAVFEEKSAQSTNFKTIFAAYEDFRKRQNTWWAFAERSMMMINTSR